MPELGSQTPSVGFGDNNVTVTGAPYTFPMGSEGHVFIVTDDGTCTGVVEEMYIYDENCANWISMKLPDEITSFVIPPVVTYPTASTANIQLVYNQEGGTQQTINIPLTFPTPASSLTNWDVALTQGANNTLSVTVSGTYTDDNGVVQNFTDTETVTLANEDYVEYTGNNTVPTGAPPAGVDTRVLVNGDRYDWNGSAWVLVPVPAPTQYLTCDGSVLAATDKILTAPTGAFANGYAVNNETADACVTRADWYYNLTRRSFTAGKNYMSNDAQGYGSTVAGGLRNTTATGASYSFIGGGYDHSITTGTANTVGGGRNNDILAGSYGTIVGGYNQNINIGSGSYNILGGVNNNTYGGSYNNLFGNANRNDAGNSNNLLGQSNRVRTGSYVFQGGYSHDNVAGNATTQLGYNHSNTRGSYNFQGGYGHIIDNGQSVTQSGQSHRNRAGNYTGQIGFSHDNVTGTGNFQSGYNQTNTAGSYNTQLGVNNRNTAGNSNSIIGNGNIHKSGSYSVLMGYSHDNTGTANTLLTYNNTVLGGNYNFMAGVNGIHRSGSYNAQLGFSHDSTGSGNMLIGYNNTTNTNYSVSIGRNLNNTTQDGIMIANTFQKIGFFGIAPIAKQTANTLPQLLTALKAYGLIN